MKLNIRLILIGAMFLSFSIIGSKVSEAEITMSEENIQIMDSDESSVTEYSLSAEEKTSSNSTIPVYRVYNPNSNEHLHTLSQNERDSLISIGWRNEGISMQVSNTGTPVYRVYNPNSGEHFYTINSSEKESLAKNGWHNEGIAWSYDPNGTPVYRVYNPNAKDAGSHHYTMNIAEKDNLVKNGWIDEGTAFNSNGDEIPVASYVLLNSPFIDQRKAGYPMGCEAASLLEALQTKGYARSYNLGNFIKEMPMSPNNNPNNGFSGKPDNVVSGVYHSIYAKPLADWGMRYGNVSDITGSSVENLKDQLRTGNPVVVYVTLNFASPQYGNYWFGSAINNAHIVTLDGFNESNQTYHVSDPNKGQYWVNAQSFEASYNLRKSAVVIK
ncbi:C39 family peptidase [Enterococcus sp. AZ103]|uniref:C39 family peptidase n=1 Tax=Enterococcus sp. AZ103 TaxID=2774628 RepID=UPI003F25212C